MFWLVNVYFGLVIVVVGGLFVFTLLSICTLLIYSYKSILNNYKRAARSKHKPAVTTK